MGVEVNVTCSTRSTIRSSISNNDMWQPAQPASQSLATVTLVGHSSISSPSVSRMPQAIGQQSQRRAIRLHARGGLW